jgi:head-tail adaptor
MIQGYYNKQATLYRPVITEVSGSPVEIFAAVGGAFPCGIDAKSGRERVQRDKVDEVAEYVIFTDIRDIRAQDRIKIDGVDYEVVFVDDPCVMGHHLEIDCRIIK